MNFDKFKSFYTDVKTKRLRSASPDEIANDENQAKRIKTMLPPEELHKLNETLNDYERRYNLKWGRSLREHLELPPDGDSSSSSDDDDDDSDFLLSSILLKVLSELHKTSWKNRFLSLDKETMLSLLVGMTAEEKVDLRSQIQMSIDNKNWENFTTYEKIRKMSPDPGPQRQIQKAIEDSWQMPFQGEAANALWEHICGYTKRPSEIDTLYALYTSISQSSGMGKSRCVDELSKTHFVIPINLRGTSGGFPPADGEVLKFLMELKDDSQVYRRMLCFLSALFEETTLTLRELNLKCDYDRRMESVMKYAQLFRDFMSAGQVWQNHGTERINFYSRVVKRTRLLEKKHGYLSREDTSPKGPKHASVVQDAFHRLRACLYEDPPESASQQSSLERGNECQTNTSPPLIILAFDEAHTLTHRYNEDGSRTAHFSEMRRALRVLSPWPVFTLFLSTMGAISQSVGPRVVDPSARLEQGQLQSIPPFTQLGFDQLAGDDKIGDGTHTLEDVTCMEFISKLGRPLFGSRFSLGNGKVKGDILKFAQTKLISVNPQTRPATFNPHQYLACLSQRLALEFNSTTYMDYQVKQEQVEGYMRVCLQVANGFETMKTISPSEPLLAEAAARFMISEDFNSVQALKSVLEGFSINRGDRGELLVLQLFTMARDQCYIDSRLQRIIEVRRFMDNLFNVDTSSHTPSVWRIGDEKKSFRDLMKNARMHFNHVIRPHQQSVTSHKFLHLILARGAQLLCAAGQKAIDGLIPFLFYDTRIRRSNIGFILWQVKNDPAFTSTPIAALFEVMDPFFLKLFKEGDEPIPIIRIVFALAAKKPGITLMRYSKCLSNEYTSFDYWCAGLSVTNLKPILEQQEATWKALLEASYPWKQLYTSPDKELKQSQHPGGGDDFGFWRNWSTGETSNQDVASNQDDITSSD